MTWQSMAAVLDAAVTQETEAAAIIARDRATKVRANDFLLCPGCDKAIVREAMATHFHSVHEDRDNACDFRGCLFLADNAISLAGHKRYRHRTRDR